MLSQLKTLETIDEDLFQFYCAEADGLATSEDQLDVTLESYMLLISLAKEADINTVPCLDTLAKINHLARTSQK